MGETNCSSGDSGSASAPRPRLNWQLAGLGALFSVAIVLVVWIETNTWRQMQFLKNDFAEANLESFYLGAHLREGIERMNGALFRFQLSQDEEERALFKREASGLSSRIEISKAHLVTEAERNLVAQIEAAFSSYQTNTASFLERGVRAVRKDTASILHHQLTARSAPLVALADRLVQTQQGALDRFFGSAGAALGSLQRLLAVSVLLLVLLVVAVAALMSRAVIAPLRAQLDASQVIIERQEKLASLGVLAAGVAHEIRNPLTAIKLRLFSLKKSLPEGFEHNEDATVIASELNRLDRIVRDFLQFARPSDPELVSIPVDAVLREVGALLRVELERRHITLQTEAVPGLMIRADRQQLQQVLINLVQNAADSIEQTGAIALRARPSQATPGVVIEVADTGRGIPPEAERRIFDPFFSTKESGTGLGLAIASRIVEKHGGVIQFTTQAGHGTTFSLTIPG